MPELTYNELPAAIAKLSEKVDSIEQLLIQIVNPAPQPKDEFLTIREAAELVDLAVPTVYSLVSRAEIPVSKKGKRLYFSRTELIDWIKSGRKLTKDELEAKASNFLARKRKLSSPASK